MGAPKVGRIRTNNLPLGTILTPETDTFLLVADAKLFVKICKSGTKVLASLLYL